MALSPQYSWPEPDNSSLVKNGAQDIRALGDAIDTSVWNVGYGQAGKNKVINGDFGIWQRGTTFTNPSGYTVDRFNVGYGTAAPTSNSVTQQTFTPGTAPVAGYEGTFFYRSTITTVGTTTRVSTNTPIENVRTFAGQTVTLSFYAKADSARTLTGFIQQNFGSGGSAVVSTAIASQSITTAWARYSTTISLPSISGKTIGTSNFLLIRLDQAVAAGSELDLWGVQLEYGSKATPFQTASGGSPQSELAMCQRYYERIVSGNIFGLIGTGKSYTTGQLQINLPFKVTKRVVPTAIDTSAMATFQYETGATAGNTPTTIAISTSVTSTQNGGVDVSKATSFTIGSYYYLTGNNDTTTFIGWSAEL